MRWTPPSPRLCSPADGGGDLPRADRRARAPRTRCATLLADVSGLRRSVGFRIPEGELTCVVGRRLRALGPAVRRAPPGRPAPLCRARRGQGTPPSHAGRPAVPHPRPSVGPVLRARPAADGPAARARAGGRRGARLQVLRRAGPARVRRRHREPRGRGGGRRRARRRRGPGFAGGSYVVVQKYLHDLEAWDALPVEEQERAIGREARATRAARTRSSRPTRTSRSTRSPTRTARSARSCASTCRSAASATASSGPTSSATPARRK